MILRHERLIIIFLGGIMLAVTTWTGQGAGDFWYFMIVWAISATCRRDE